VAIDVAGHEMTHGVTEATAGLTYSNDAGGLNEASSDIMGTMVEYYVNNAADPGDYMIGEKIYRSNPTGHTALRYMFLPGAADGNRSYNCYPAGGLTGVDPHYSSGPGNHFYYLLAEGAVSPAGFGYTASQLVCNGDTGVTGIGRDAAQRIYYRALTVYYTSTETYPKARADTLQGRRRSVRLRFDAVQRRCARVERRQRQLIRRYRDTKRPAQAGRFLLVATGNRTAVSGGVRPRRGRGRVPVPRRLLRAPRRCRCRNAGPCRPSDGSDRRRPRSCRPSGSSPRAARNSC